MAIYYTYINGKWVLAPDFVNDEKEEEPTLTDLLLEVMTPKK